jgi:hypothetical protein
MASGQRSAISYQQKQEVIKSGRLLLIYWDNATNCIDL